MRSETFSTESGITAMVRSRNRRTTLIEAQYSQALRTAYPSIAEFELAQLGASMPNLPIDDKGALTRPLTTLEQQALNAYTGHTALIRTQHAVGAAYFEGMSTVVPLLARIVTVGGAPFHADADGRLPDADVAAAFEDWLNDDEEATGFWGTLAKTVQGIDAPLTPVQQKPPETLTLEEQADPLSVAGVAPGSSA